MVRTLAGCVGSATAFSNISFSKSTKKLKGSYALEKMILNESQNQIGLYAGAYLQTYLFVLQCAYEEKWLHQGVARSFG